MTAQPEEFERRSGQDRRKGGRPRLVEGCDSEPITVRVELPLYDALCLRAIREGYTDLAPFLRVLLRSFVVKTSQPPTTPVE